MSIIEYERIYNFINFENLSYLLSWFLLFELIKSFSPKPVIFSDEEDEKKSKNEKNTFLVNWMSLVHAIILIVFGTLLHP